MTEQKIIDWTPENNIPVLVFVEKLVDDYDGLHIYLQGSLDNNTLIIHFSDFFMYRNVGESYYLRTIDNVPKNRSTPLYIVKDSLLIKWFHDESYGIYRDEDISHFLILAGNDCIDVLSRIPPVVSWEKTQQFPR